MKLPLLALALLLSLSLSLSPRAARCADPALPPGMAQFVVGLLYRGPAWTADDTPAVQKLQAAHMASLKRLVDSGQLAVAGPFDGTGDLRGMLIFNVRTVPEAQALAATDPALAAGRLRVELHVWYGPAAIATAARATGGAR